MKKPAMMLLTKKKKKKKKKEEEEIDNQEEDENDEHQNDDHNDKNNVNSESNQALSKSIINIQEGLFFCLRHNVDVISPPGSTQINMGFAGERDISLRYSNYKKNLLEKIEEKFFNFQPTTTFLV